MYIITPPTRLRKWIAENLAISRKGTSDIKIYQEHDSVSVDFELQTSNMKTCPHSLATCNSQQSQAHSGPINGPLTEQLCIHHLWTQKPVYPLSYTHTPNDCWLISPTSISMFFQHPTILGELSRFIGYLIYHMPSLSFSPHILLWESKQLHFNETGTETIKSNQTLLEIDGNIWN